MQSNNAAPLRLRVLVEADPGALVRVLHLIQGRNIVPLQVSAQRLDAHSLAVEIALDAADLTVEAFRVIAGKIAELPVVLDASACD